MLLLAVLTASLVSLSNCDPEVSLDLGILKGKVLQSREGKDILSFQGIPYAKPPVKELRFKAPQDAEAWEGIRSAQTEGSVCAQYDWITETFTGEEDCLFINVYTPQIEREGAGLSVMVWVHGGSFYSGSGNSKRFSPEFLLDHDVVLVTLNYRLDALGFFSLGTTETSGNYGLKDQVAALRWVNKNIAKFGGNPQSVTIFGESAGGASIHYLLLSPLARGLFHRAIVQSGSAYNPWAIPKRNSTKLSRDLADLLNCTNEETMLTCLREVDYTLFPIISRQIKIKKGMVTVFVPVIEPNNTEDAFLTENPHLLHSQGNISNVPIMAGCVTYEALDYLHSIRAKNISAESAMNNYPYAFVPRTLGFKVHSEKQVIGLEIISFFKSLYPDDPEEQFLQALSDQYIVYGVDKMVRDVASLRRKPVFYYIFSYDGGRGFNKNLLNMSYNGTAHMDELGYMFGGQVYPSLNITSSLDLVTIDRVTKLWTDFAKTGNPTPADSNLGVQWRQVSVQENSVSTRYLDIGKELVMKEENLKGEQSVFWDQLHKRYQNIIVTQNIVDTK